MRAVTRGPVALSIAGFDPSSGAGITADLKTMSAYGVYGVCGITALTVQNSVGVRSVHAVDASVLRDSLNALADDLSIAAVKIGMLATAALADIVADFLEQLDCKIVVLDPVLMSSSGRALLDDGGRQTLIDRLLPLATVMTPNVHEGSSLTTLAIDSAEDAIVAAERLLELGARAVVVTGGHLAEPIDVLVQRGVESVRFRGERIDTRSTHGTGCTFSSALCCELLRGSPLESAVRNAKEYVTGAMIVASPVGRGQGPLEHFWKE